MKLRKKILGMLLAVSMIISTLSMNVFAATDGKITINNTNTAVSMKGHTYTAYKLFDVTYDDAKVNYSYTMSEGFKSFFASKGCLTDGMAYDFVNKIQGTEAMQAFAKEAYANKGSAVGISAKATAKDSVVISGLDHGYYLVYDEGSDSALDNEERTVAAAVLTTTRPEAIVNLKADAPALNKVITGVTKESSNLVGDLNVVAVDAQIGEHIQFKLASKVSDLTGYTAYTYIVQDTLSKGLAFDNNVKVMIGGVDKTSQCVIAPNGQSFTVKVPFETLKASNKNDAIVVTYSAKLNNDAEIYEGVNTNTVNLKYSNNPNDVTSTDTTPDKVVKVYTFTMDLTKQNKKGEVLSGAEFQFKDSEGNYIPVIKDLVTGRYRVDGERIGTVENSVVVSNAKGKIYVDGLKAAVYRITETKAPNGYNKLTEDITMTIEAKYNDDVTLVSSVQGNTPVVINSTGSLLPGTGGIGTTIFVVTGMSIMSAAMVILFLKKRKQGKQS